VVTSPAPLMVVKAGVTRTSKIAISPMTTSSSRSVNPRERPRSFGNVNACRPGGLNSNVKTLRLRCFDVKPAKRSRSSRTVKVGGGFGLFGARVFKVTGNSPYILYWQKRRANSLILRLFPGVLRRNWEAKQKPQGWEFGQGGRLEQGAGSGGAGSREQGLRLVRPTARREPEGQTSEVRGRRFEIRRQQGAPAFGFRRGAYSGASAAMLRRFQRSTSNAQRPTLQWRRLRCSSLSRQRTDVRGQTSDVRSQTTSYRSRFTTLDSRSWFERSLLDHN